MSRAQSKRLPPDPKPMPEENDSGKGAYDPKRERRAPCFTRIDAEIDMDRAEKAAVAARARAARAKTASLGRRRKKSTPNLPREEYEKLATAFIVFADTLRRDFAETIAGNLRAFRSDLLRLILGEFQLKRGRPRDPRLDAASRRLHQGEPDQDILRSEIADFDARQPFERDLLIRGLHQAANRRRPKPRKGTRNESRKRSCNTPSAIPPPDHPVN